MVIVDMPEARLKLGSSLSGDNIREGSDVYFDCLIDANPPVTKVDWRHNVSVYIYFIPVKSNVHVCVYVFIDNWLCAGSNVISQHKRRNHNDKPKFSVAKSDSTLSRELLVHWTEF